MGLEMGLSVTEDKYWETQKDVDWQARWTGYQKNTIPRALSGRDWPGGWSGASCLTLP